MPYNSAFPIGYQAPAWQQPAQQQGAGIIWVQGEAGAKSYLVAPNSTVQLWDSEAQTIYLKSADASGMPSIKTLDYTIRETIAKPAPAAWASREDLEALREEIEKLKEAMA